MAYAIYDDYILQYPGDNAEKTHIEYLLGQASDAVDMAFRSRGRSLPEDTGDMLLLRACRRVTCQLANRALSFEGSGELSGAFADTTQLSMTAGPYTQSYTLSGNGSNLRLNAADLESLGLNGGAAGFGKGASDD